VKAHQSIAATLRKLGVDTMFGLVGDANLLMVHSFVASGGHYISAANEAAATLMAVGYASTSGELGLATVTHGPGLTNTVTPLVHGVRSHTAMVLIAADTPAHDRDHLQSVDQRELVSATGAGFEQMRSPTTISEDVSRACRRAIEESRPIVLNMPTEFKLVDVDAPVVVDLPARQRIRPDIAALDDAVGLVASASRPIVLAGRGAISPAARSALIGLADRIDAPLATTLKAKDLFRDHPHDLGVFGTLSSSIAAETIAASDCILAFGASLNGWTTASGGYTQKRRIMHCDVSLSRIGRFTPVDAAVVGDAATTAETIVEWLDEGEVEGSGFAGPALADKLRHWTHDPYTDQSDTDSVDIRTALQALEAAVPDDRTAVFDAGRFSIPALKFLHAPNPYAWVPTLDFASIGLGVPTAIGASFGRPGHPVLVVTGDGGFMLGGLAEFNTAVRHHVDLIVAVLNDGAYGAELRHLRNYELGTELSQFNWPDFADVAAALGGEAATVSCPADLEKLSDVIENRRGPLLIDIKLDPLHVPAPEDG
jgi:thiamine pyrophosphate-dependent acetolactate synthase large subunit-like protein